MNRKQRAAAYAARTPQGTVFDFALTPARRARGSLGASWFVEELYALIPEGGAIVVFSSYGYVRGVERFGREVLVCGDGCVDVVLPDGDTSVSYPLGQGRTVRLLIA